MADGAGGPDPDSGEEGDRPSWSSGDPIPSDRGGRAILQHRRIHLFGDYNAARQCLTGLFMDRAYASVSIPVVP